MLTKSVIDQYVPTIGIECHVQLKTKTKLFSAVNNDAREAEPNTLISPIDYGLPGVLPVLNKKAVELAVRAGAALNAEVALFSKFDRKHYFYPDLPKGYQITQFDQPTVGVGRVYVPYDGEIREVGITRAHIEEDAGKSTHPAGKDYSLVDLNRAGTPLLEIVSDPDIDSPGLARAYARELYLLMKYADVSEVNLYHGNMRFDVNISVAKIGSEQLGTRAEVKNLNSFRSVEKAAEYEIKRQIEILEKGEKVIQETRGWDDAKMRTTSQRSKEEATDYRYFPEPDLPPILLTQDFIDKTASQLKLLPAKIRQDLTVAGVDSDSVETLLEYPELINNLYAEIDYGAKPSDIKRIANWFANEITKLITEDDDELFSQVGNLTKLSQMVEAGDLSSSAAKTIIQKTYTNFIDPEESAKSLNLVQESNIDAIAKIVSEVIAANPQAAQDVRNGEEKAIGFLVGQVMKASKGQANPQVASAEIKKQL
jgi:aspartyl-tRNA(Asn)/glutamyl-tRNA(Gln) amidotransferase subunit B